MSILDASLSSDLWFFRIVAEAGTLRVAADRLAVTQSAVTQRIQRLESRLAVTLFDRTQRQMRLTYSGRVLFEATKTGFDEIAGALSRLRASNTNPSIKVSCLPSLALEWMMPALPRFLALNPEIGVTVFAEMHDLDRSRMALEGVDVAIRYGPQPPRGAPVLYTVPEYTFPVASPELKSQMTNAANPAAVATILHDAMPWEHAASETAEWSDWIDRHGVPYGAQRRDLFFNLAQLAYRSAIEGVGIAIGRGLVVDRYMRQRRLVPATTTAPIQVHNYYVSTRFETPSADVAKFLEWLHSEMSQTNPHYDKETS